MSTLDRDQAREALFDAHPADWDPDDRWVDDLLDALEDCSAFAWQDLEDLLAQHYPEDIFPVRADDPSVDPGPRILSLARLLHRAEAKLAAIEALCDAEDDRWRGLVGAAVTSVRVTDLRAAINGND